MMNNTTRQGVRDLNHLTGKSSGRKLKVFSDVIICKHVRVSAAHTDQHGYDCLDCGVELDWNGI